MKYIAIAGINAALFLGLYGLELTDNFAVIATGMIASSLISLKLVFW